MKRLTFLIALLMSMQMFADCVKVTGNHVNLRYGPGKGYGVCCQVNTGAVLTSYGLCSNRDWYVVEYRGQKLYVSRDYVKPCK